MDISITLSPQPLQKVICDNTEKALEWYHRYEWNLIEIPVLVSVCQCGLNAPAEDSASFQFIKVSH
jgi:hypothetical protein